MAGSKVPQKESSAVLQAAMDPFRDILGKSLEAEKLCSFVAEAAKTDLPVLLLGEAGTGKSVLAGLIHHQSPRASGPFVAVDLATIPSSLVHAELFGCKKGAFTGAERHRGVDVQRCLARRTLQALRQAQTTSSALALACWLPYLLERIQGCLRFGTWAEATSNPTAWFPSADGKLRP